jgi:hypothetical protein
MLHVLPLTYISVQGVGSMISSMGYLSLLGAESALLGANGWTTSPRSELISRIGIYTTYCEFFVVKLKNYWANVSSLLCVGSCVLCFLYIWLSSANPSFHNAIEEIAHVRPRCSSFSRAALSWSLSFYDLNSPVFYLAVRVLTFSIIMVTLELEVTNRLLSYVRD